MTQNNNTPWWRITNGAARLAARQTQTAPRQQQFSPQIPPSTDVSQDPAYQSALSGAAPLPPWSDTPISPAAQQPGTIAPPEERPATPAWLRDIANNLWRTSRTLNPIAAAVAPMPDDYGAQLADTFWSGNVPSGFAPEDTWLGKVERNRARDVMRPIWKAQSGDVGGAIRDIAQSQALSTAGGQGAAAVADVSGRIFNPQPGQEPVKFGDAAGAVMGAIGGSSIPFAPRELFDVMNVAPQAIETLTGRLGAAIPDTVKIGNVELPNPIKGPGFNMFANAAKFADAPRSYVENLASAVISGDHAKLYSAIGLTGSKDIKAQAQEFQAGLGVDLTAKWRGKNAAISDPAGALESSLFQSPEEYAMWRAAPMAASGSQAYLTGIKRILAGEDPQAVIKGEYMPAPRQELFIDERNRYDEVVKRHIEAAGVLAEQGALRAGQPYAVVQEQGEAARAMADKQVRETGMVRGEESPLAELFAQTVIGFAMARGGLDPVNRIPFHQMFGLKAFMPTPKRPNILNEVYDSAAEVAGKTYKMGEALEATKRGLSPEQLAGEARALSTLDAARKAQAPAPPPSEGAVAAPRERAPTLMARAGAAAYLTYIHAVEFLPQAKAKGAAGYALDLIHSLTRDAQNPMEAFAALRQWILDPSSMRATYDTVPVSFKAELARPIIEGLGGGDKAKAIEVLGKLAEKAAKAEELAARAAEARAKTGESTEEAQAKRFTSLGFLGEMAPLLQKSAETIHGVKPLAERSAIERWGTEVKSWLGEFYLRTLGYVFRNTMSDSVVMAMDGLYSFEGMKQIESHMGKIGLTEDYIKSESQAEGSGQESKLAKIPIIGPIQGWVGKTNNNWEVARRTRAFYNGFKQFMGLNWEPAIGADVVQALGPELAHVANTLRDGWRSGQTVNEIKAATLKALKNRVAGFDATGFPLDAKMAAVLSPELQARTRADMQRIYDENRVALGDEAAKTKALDEATAKAKTTIEADYIRRIAALGPVVNPSPSSVRTFQEDQQEFEQTMTKLAKDTLPAGPERDALVEQLKRGYSEREQAIIAARDLVAKRLAGLPANAPAEDVAKLIVYAHEVDHQIRNTTRLAQDAAVKEAWDAIAGMGKRGSKQARSADMRAVWDDYRAKNDPVQQKMSADIATSYEWVADAIERLTTDPTSFEAIAKERPDWDKNGDFAGSVIREAVNLAKGEYTRFEDVLNLTRSGIDLARANAFALAKRLATGDSTVAARVFDVLSTAERDVTRHAAITLGEIRAALARKDAGQITFDQYKDIADEKWGEHGRWARTRYNEYAMNSLTWVEIESGQLAKGLRELGYSNEQIADLLKKAATSDNGAAIAKIFEKATGPTTPPADGKPPPDQPGLFPDGGTPAPKPPPGAPPAPGGAEAGPAAKPAAQIAEEAKNLAADARDLAARAKISPTADNIDLAREAEARAKPSREAIIMERMAVRAEETAKRTPTEANKAAAVKARQIADESWLSYEQERLNPKPITPAQAGAADAVPTPADAVPAGTKPGTKPGKKSAVQQATEYIATTTGATAEQVAKKFRIPLPQAEKLVAAEAAKSAPPKDDATPANLPKPKLSFPPGAPAEPGAPPPEPLDARIVPLAYDVADVDPRRLLTAIAPDDRQYATVLMILPSDKVKGSHDAEGRATPGFPPDHQPRGETRSGAEFVAQRQRITNRFRVGEVTEISSDVTKGVSMLAKPTPDANGDYNLVGGNMRRAAEAWLEANQPGGTVEADSIQKLYDTRRAIAKRYGISEAEIAAAGDKPILVRAFVSEITPAKAAVISNKAYIAAAAPMERAREYVGMIDRGMLDSFKMGEDMTIDDALRDPSNAVFIKALVERIPPNDRTAVMSGGKLTDEGVKMVKYAIFLKAYSSPAGEKIVRRLIDASGEEKAIGDALFRSISSTLEVESLAASGQIPDGLSLTDDISKALEMFDYARSLAQNRPVNDKEIPLPTMIQNAILAGDPMFPDPNTPEFGPTTRAVATILAMNANAPKVMAAFVDQYNAAVLSSRPGFVQPLGENPTKSEVINHVLSENLRRTQERAGATPAALKQAEIDLGVAQGAKGGKKADRQAAIEAAKASRDKIARAIESAKSQDPIFKSPADLLLETKPRDQRAYLPPKEGDAPLAGETTPPTQVNERPISMAETRPGTTAQQVEDGRNFLRSLRDGMAGVTMTSAWEEVAPAYKAVVATPEGKALLERSQDPSLSDRIHGNARAKLGEMIRAEMEKGNWPPTTNAKDIADMVGEVSRLQQTEAASAVRTPGIKGAATGQEIQHAGVRAAYEGMVADGSAPVVGAKFSGHAELAEMGSKLWRDPKVEYARLVFTKGDQIVGEVVYSQRLTGAVNWQTTVVNPATNIVDTLFKFRDWVKVQAEQHGADGVWDLHNHPNADPTPSGADRTFAAANERDLGPLYRGSLVINSHEYSFHTPGNSDAQKVAVFDRGTLADPGQRPVFAVYDAPFPVTKALPGGKSLVPSLAGEANQIANLAWLGRGEDYAVVIGADVGEGGQGYVTGVSFIRDPRNYSSNPRREAAVRSFMRATGSVIAVVVPPSGAKVYDTADRRVWPWTGDQAGTVASTGRKYHVYDTWGASKLHVTASKHIENWANTPVVDRIQAVIDAFRDKIISPGTARKMIAEMAAQDGSSAAPADTVAGIRTPEEEAEAVRAKQAEREQARYGGVGPDLAAQNAKGLADLQGATAPRPVPADAGGAGRPPVEPPGPPPPPGEPPAPDPRNIDPDAQTPENIALQESALHNEGDHEAPRFEDMAKAAFQEQRSALDAMRKSAEEYNARPIPEGALTPEAEAAIFRAEAEAIRKYNRTFDAAKTYAREATNFTLLDYAQKRGFDTWLSAIAPFSYWATRQGRNFALRLMQNPAYLTAYLRFKLALEDENRKRWTRSRFKGSVKIPLSDISGGKMNDIYADPIEVFFPFAGLMGQDVTDPEGQRTGVQQVYNMAETLGLRPSPPIDIALRASGALQADNSPEQQAAWGRGSIGAFTPQGSMIQGATAALGIGGPGGWNPEEPIRRAVGLPDTVAYDPYRYGRSVADISAVLNVMQGESMDPRPFLAAQEWIGKHRDSDLANQLRKATPDDVAKELNIDPKLAVQALEIARAGARQASKQRAVGQLGSSLLGLRLQELPQGEMIRTGMADAERGAAFNPATGTGSREAVKAVQAQYPALQVQRGQYQALPGDSRDSSYLFDNAQKQIVNKAFDQLSESVLTARPWDRRATRLVEDARYTALARTDRTSPSAPGDWQTEYQRAVAKIAGGDSVTATAPNLAYRPLSVAGASPAEATQIRQQEIMRAIVRTQPRAEAFTKQDGQIDFAAYNAARADWESALPTIAKGIPEVFAVVGQADKEGRGVNLRAWLDKLGPDQLDEYKRRNDTPLEAAQRTYFEGIYQPAMDAYRKASDLGVPDAWNQTVGKLGTVRGSDIVPMMQQVYGNRFSPEELASLNTLAFPPAQDVMRANMSDSAKIKDAARSAFWDFMNTATPPGSPSYSLRQEALIGAALDQSSRATVTAEQYALALSMARGWVATNYGEVTPEMQAEWNSARAAKKELDNLILTQLGPEGAIALRAYQAAQSAADKAAVRRSNPIVQKALNLQLLFANKNKVFGKYYKSAKGAAVARIKSIRR